METIFHDVAELFSNYIGKVNYEETGGRYYPYEISITNNNRLIKHRTDGSVFADRYVKCTVTVDYDREDHYGIRAEEGTYSILGGSACGGLSIEEALSRAKYELERYNFALKQDEQLRLF